MHGAIIGDIVGSRFEFHNYKGKNFNLFMPGCSVTDDSVMTLAVAKALLETAKALPEEEAGERGPAFYSLLRENAVRYMRDVGRRYPHCGYGGMFSRWMFSGEPRPYNSYGNGAAMRVSPAGFAARTEEEALKLAEAVTDVTHSHPEGVKGAQAAALVIFMARNGASKESIRKRIERDFYPLNFTVDEIRPGYDFDESCQGTVPQAIACFLESESFEDAVRTAVSLGGDSDTLACITGGMAEAFYGVPGELWEGAKPYLDEYLTALYGEWVAWRLRDKAPGA